MAVNWLEDDGGKTPPPPQTPMAHGYLDGRLVYAGQSGACWREDCTDGKCCDDGVLSVFVQLESPRVAAWLTYAADFPKELGGRYLSMQLSCPWLEPITLERRITEERLSLDEVALCCAWWLSYHLNGGTWQELVELREELWRDLG